MVNNSGLPCAETKVSNGFRTIVSYREITGDWEAGALLEMGTNIHLKAEVITAYNSPFPDHSYMAALNAIFNLLPQSPSEKQAVINKKYWNELTKLDIPIKSFFGADDIMWTNYVDKFKECKGAQGIDQDLISNVNHFIQEDDPKLLSRKMIDFVRTHNPE